MNKCFPIAGLLIASLMAQPVSAMGLIVMEKARFSDELPINTIIVRDILGETPSGKPFLKLYPDRDAKHKEIIELLAPGMPIEKPEVQSEIAGILRSFPDQCRDQILVGLVISPVEDINTWIPDVKDKRRIGIVSVENCLAVQPEECTYTMRDNGATDFDIGSLKRILKGCVLAVEREIKNGAQLAKPVKTGVGR